MRLPNSERNYNKWQKVKLKKIQQRNSTEKYHKQTKINWYGDNHPAILP